jgi:succinate dehydrogenase/fumarate reductase flavoprotein subunit
VLIIGGGLAGLSAGVEAHRNGARVILLEKEAKCVFRSKFLLSLSFFFLSNAVLIFTFCSIGGNSAKATSGINGVYTAAQKRANSQDTLEAFRADTLRYYFSIIKFACKLAR